MALTFDQEARAALALFDRGDLTAARALVQKLLRMDDRRADLWSLASEISLREGRIPDAATAAHRAADLDPDSRARQVKNAYCQLLGGAVAAAMSAARTALSKGGLSADQLAVLAAVFWQGEEHEEAMELYRQATIVDPCNARVLRGLAEASRALGRIDDAEIAVGNLLAIDPSDCEMLHFRSSLHRQTESSNHVDQLKGVLRHSTPHWRGVVQVMHALAKELEDLGRYEESFSYLRRGASLKRQHIQYDLAGELAMLRQIRAAFSRETIASLQGNGNSSAEPIFVLGLPRTGSTLVERIISSHPDVRSAGELTTFALELVKLATAGNGGRPPERALLAQASTRIDMRILGANYLRAARSPNWRTSRFIDKMPMNALYIGLIHLALPNARIVLVERDAADNCYAMYKFLFRNAYPFSYDLEELANYYLAHQELMAHWLSVLPTGAVCRIKYEELIANPETESRRLIGELGLAWSSSCLDFDVNRSAATTGSATQVRQPIYRSSVGLWRHYRQQLQPMIRILVAGGVILNQSDRR